MFCIANAGICRSNQTFEPIIRLRDFFDSCSVFLETVKGCGGYKLNK